MLDPAYLAGLDTRPVDDLRTMHAECLELETEVSYVRRLIQARIDILEAELARRASGGTLEDLINALPQILADPGPGPTRRAAGCPRRWRPTRRASGPATSRSPTTCSPTCRRSSDDELRSAMERLRIARA